MDDDLGVYNCHQKKYSLST